MKFMEFLTKVGEFGHAIHQQMQLVATIKLDRQTSQQQLARLVSTMSPEELARFEEQYLTSAGMLVDVAQRVRAMELFAWLKFCEAERYGGFRGFISNGAPLP